MERFEIKSDLLKQAMWGGHWCKNGYLQHTDGYFYNDKNNFGRAFIEFCVKKIFNIQCFPGFEHFYTDGGNYKFQREFRNLKEDDILFACEELKRYYGFLQNELKKPEYEAKNGKICIARSLRPYEIEKAIPQIIAKSEKVHIPANVINSYAHQKGDYYYGTSMYIEREVDISRIILWEETLIGPGSKCEHLFFETEKEVWVIEDNIFGETELDISCFHYEGELKGKVGHKYFFDYKEDNPIFMPEKDAPKPCEWNKFTQWLIKRNMKEIEKIYPRGKFEK